MVIILSSPHCIADTYFGGMVTLSLNDWFILVKTNHYSYILPGTGSYVDNPTQVNQCTAFLRYLVQTGLVFNASSTCEKYVGWSKLKEWTQKHVEDRRSEALMATLQVGCLMRRDTALALYYNNHYIAYCASPSPGSSLAEYYGVYFSYTSLNSF
jgi:hypothetical protein